MWLELLKNSRLEDIGGLAEIGIGKNTIKGCC
ncbi:MAG: hypothetical protein ACI8ZB_000752 [Desulforhopalus sp.]|jgi:hypothetical protein